MWGAVVDAIKHAHDETVGRGLDMWQTNYMDRKIQNRSYNLNKSLWEHQMSNAYQLTVEDMRKAGLNPMLTIGNGASSVGGHASSPSGYNGRKDSNWMPSQSLVAAKQMKLLESQSEKNKADAALASANAKSAEAQATINKAIEKVWKNNKDVAAWKVLEDVLPKNVVGLLASLVGYTVQHREPTQPKQRKAPRPEGASGMAIEKHFKYSDTR